MRTTLVFVLINALIFGFFTLMNTYEGTFNTNVGLNVQSESNHSAMTNTPILDRYDVPHQDDPLELNAQNDKVEMEHNQIHLLNFKQLSQWVYSGSASLQNRALEYLPEYAEKALPLLIFLVDTSVDIGMKEQAILVIEQLDPAIAKPLLQAMMDNTLVAEFITSLGYERPVIEIYNSPYQSLVNENSLSDLKEIVSWLKEPEVISRMQIIKNVAQLDTKDAVKILTHMGQLDYSPELRKLALERGARIYPTQFKKWLNMALMDVNEDIQLMGLTWLRNIQFTDESFVPTLGQLVLNAQSNLVKDQAIAILISFNSPAADVFVGQTKSSY
jgi:hypothetical protein